MSQLLSIVYKELLLLSRDIHGLLLLFVMPTVFILIMSLAMQDDFSSRAGGKIDVLLENTSGSELSVRFIELLEDNAVFSFVTVESTLKTQQQIKDDEFKFLLKIEETFVEQLLSEDNEQAIESSVVITVAPSTSRQMEIIFHSVVAQSVARLRLENMMAAMQLAMPDGDVGQINLQFDMGSMVSVTYSGQASGQDQSVAPNSVQQSVPAWLVFSLFFVVVPLSNTLINERNLGTLKRMRTMNVHPFSVVLGKLIPYFFINQIQVVLMLLVGIFLVPVFGGDSLTLGNSGFGLLLMSVAISCAALGYAMLIAVIARTVEQATTLGGTGNIILAAVGGIMVPTFIMPQFMQDLSRLSPMSWGLQGFLDILLRDGASIDVLPEFATLIMFGVLCLFVAALLFAKQSQND